MWSDDVIAGYKQNLLLGNLVTKLNHKGKKGDTVHIPTPSRGSAALKAASTQVTLNSATHSVINLLIDKHYEYSFLIEDILAVQGFPSLRRFYTDDAGYALAKQVDQDLHLLGAGLQGGTAANGYDKAVIAGDGSTLFSGTANTNTGNGSAITDVGIRKMIQTLDDGDVPMGNRALILPPVEKNVLLGISRFTEQAFVGNGTALQTGKIGEIYGIPVYISTACPWLHVDSADGDKAINFSSTSLSGAVTDSLGRAVTFTTDATKYRIGMLLHKDAFAFVEQMGVRSQTQYKQEYLADLFTADTIYGTGELRDASGIAFVMPS